MRRIRGLKVSEDRIRVLRSVVDEHLAMRPSIPDSSPGFSEVEWKMLDKWHNDAWKALKKAEDDLNDQTEGNM
eukprot:jgi/Botrbrau1/16034/Bobra.7_2s0008.1